MNAIGRLDGVADENSPAVLRIVPRHAAEATRVLWQVWLWVATYGKEAVRQAATARGYSDDEIREAERRCLK